MAVDKLRYKEAQRVLDDHNFRGYMEKLMNKYVLDKTKPQLRLELSNDGRAYTNFSFVHIAPIELLFEDSFGTDKFGQMVETIIKEKGFAAFLKLMLKTELSHEVDGHINCTVESVHKDFLAEACDYYEDEFNLNRSVMKHCAHTFFNILEDGRIENSIMYRTPAMVKPFTLLNWLVRRYNEIEKEPQNISEEYSAFISMMLSYCKTGYTALGIDLCKGHESYKVFYDIKDDIDNVVYATTCREGTWYMMDIIKKTGPFIAKCLEEDSNIADMFEQFIRSYVADECSEQKNKGKANSRQKGIKKTEENRQKEAAQDKAKSSSKNDSSESEEEKPEESSDNSSKEDEAAEEKEEKETRDSKEDSGKTASDSEGDESDPDEDSDSEGDESDPDEDSDSEGDESDPDEDSDSEGDELENPNNDFSEIEESESEEIEAKRDTVEISEAERPIEDIGFDKEDWKDILDSITNCDKECREVQTIKRSSISVTDNGVVREKITERGEFQEIHFSFENVPLPNTLSLIARKLSKSLEEILESKRERRNLNRGRIDQRNLYKMGVKSLNVFQKKGVPFKSIAVYILRDSSGSMAGEKDRESIQTCAILEEALKKYAAIKISSFSASGSNVYHYTMREFIDKGPNRSLGFFQVHKASGGNKDGVSIRIATKELKARSEKKKILFVLSDGLPSAYNSDTIALNDVRCAVEEARKAGIKVIPIMYGDPKFFDGSRKDYEFMYQRDILACSPKDLTKTLVPIFCGIFKG